MIKIGNNNSIIGSPVGNHFHGTYYIIRLKDGKKIKLWFCGSQLKRILDDYNIPYEVSNK